MHANFPALYLSVIVFLCLSAALCVCERAVVRESFCALRRAVIVWVVPILAVSATLTVCLCLCA